MPACVTAISSTKPFSPDAITAFRSPSSAPANGCLVFQSGCMGASAFTRSSAKANCVYIGCSTQSVPSLSKVATRCSTGTKKGPPCVVTRATKSRIEAFVAPSFQDGSGSRACASAEVERSEADKIGSKTRDERRTRRSIAEEQVIGFMVDSFSVAELAHRNSARPPRDQSKPWRLFTHCRAGRLDFRLHSIEVEARALLHRRKLDRRHRQLFHLLLHKHKAPEFVFEPVEVLLRAFFRPTIRPARALEWIEAKIGQIGHVNLGFFAEPAFWLVDEA